MVVLSNGKKSHGENANPGTKPTRMMGDIHGRIGLGGAFIGKRQGQPMAGVEGIASGQSFQVFQSTTSEVGDIKIPQHEGNESTTSSENE